MRYLLDTPEWNLGTKVPFHGSTGSIRVLCGMFHAVIIS